MKHVGLKDFMDYRFLSELKASPDGHYLSFTAVNCLEEENNYQKNLYLYDTRSDKLRQMTYQGDAGAAVWLSPDALLFPAARNQKDKEAKDKEPLTVYYRLSTDGGEAEEYMKIPAAVKSLVSLGGDKFAVVARQDNDPDREEDYDVFDEIPFWGNGRGVVNKTRSRLFLYDRTDGSLSPLVDQWTDTGCVKLAGNRLYFTASRYTDVSRRSCSIMCYSLTGGTLETLLEEKTAAFSVQFIDVLDGRVIFLGSDGLRFGSCQSADIFLCENGSARLLASLPNGVGDSVSSDCKYGGGETAVVYQNELYFIATSHCSSMLQKMDRDGRITTLFRPDGSVSGLAAAGSKLYFTGMPDGCLQELYQLDNLIGPSAAAGNARKLSDFNGWVTAQYSLSAPEPFSITSDGVLIEGYIMKPVDFSPEKTYPGILNIHGGPRGVFGSVFFHEMQYWASQGYFVFYCNPRGSDGRGDEFADLRGRYGTIDYDDLMRFTDAVLEACPQIDPKRISAAGGSYGGYMVNWIIGHTDRFACCCAQRSISNWVSKCLVTDIGHTYDMDQQASTPWENFDLMWELSPIKYADRAKTPTLFIHSDQDYRCWQAEGLQMFTALKLHGVDARLCLFHGENHELSRSGKPKHRARRLQEITQWFDRYLKH